MTFRHHLPVPNAEHRCRSIGRTTLRRLAPLLLILVAVTPVAARANDNPVANDAATVVEDRARFTVLTPRLIRMEFSEDARFEDRASLTVVNRRLPVPEYRLRRADGWLEITTAAVKLRYRQNATAFGKETLQASFDVGGRQQVWTADMPADGNLLGTVRTVDQYEGALRLGDGKRLELEPGLLSRQGWALIDDSGRLLFEGKPADNRAVPRRAGDRRDWYLFAHGRDYKGVLGDFVSIAGKIPMPPRYAFGYWWSRYWAYSDAELRELVAAMRDYGIPLDVLVIDMDWHETHGVASTSPKRTPFGGMLGWTGYSWNRALFPNPERFLDWTGTENLQVALNLHPADGIAPFEDTYDDMRAALGTAAPAAGDWIEYRLSDPDWARAYFETMLRPHEHIGVDFWWLDWQQWPESKHIAGLNNTFWLNHVFFNDMKERYPERRPLLFHRWGGLGNHRYQVGFSGDAVISWQSLAFQPYFTATASNVAYGYWSHDIGGHIDAHEDLAADGELYLRWIQYGALSPILRTHSAKSDVAERRIWMYPDYFNEMRSAVRLRYALFPYLYNAARQAYDTGVSMTRPMYYDYPEAGIAYEIPGQYMLGDDLIVAPVASPADDRTALAVQTVWLPEGAWYEWGSGRRLDGGKTIRRTVALDEIPIYVKAGSIVPMLPPGSDNLQQQSDATILAIFPGGDDRLHYYQDDGVSQDYVDGVAARTEITSRRSSGTQRIRIAPAEGHYRGMPDTRRFVLRLEGVAPAASVSVNGSRLGDETLRYDAASLTQFIDLPATDQALDIDVAWAPPHGDMAQRLAGKAGLFRRLRRLGERVKMLSARDDWAATVPNGLSQLIATPTRIHYHPQRLAAEIDGFERALAGVESTIAGMPQMTAPEAQALAEYLSFAAR